MASCWYVYGVDCKRGGICTGCPVYDEWDKSRNPTAKKGGQSDYINKDAKN